MLRRRKRKKGKFPYPKRTKAEGFFPDCKAQTQNAKANFENAKARIEKIKSNFEKVSLRAHKAKANFENAKARKKGRMPCKNIRPSELRKG